MINLLSSTLPEGGKIVGVGEAALYATIGYLIVFLGISFLIFVVWAVGMFFKHGPQKFSKKIKTSALPVDKSIAQSTNDLDAQTIAVITAAIAAYYQQQQIPCEFVIKKIKRNTKI